MVIEHLTVRRKGVIMEKSAVHKCENCGAIISVLKPGKGELNCCGRMMINVTPDEAKRVFQSHGMTRPGTP